MGQKFIEASFLDGHVQHSSYDAAEVFEALMADLSVPADQEHLQIATSGAFVCDIVNDIAFDKEPNIEQIRQHLKTLGWEPTTEQNLAEFQNEYLRVSSLAVFFNSTKYEN